MTQWYYQNSEAGRIGPMLDDEFQRLVNDGAVDNQTRVWRSGLIDWTTYAALREYDTQRETQPAPVAPAVETSSSPALAAVTEFGNCAQCSEQWPIDLLQRVNRRKLCGRCIQKDAHKAWSRKLSNHTDVDSGWLWKHVAKIAVLALIIFGVRFGIKMAVHDGKTAMKQARQTERQKMPSRP